MRGNTKKQQEAELQRKIDQVLEAQEEFLALYEQSDSPATLQAELERVKASFDQGKAKVPR